MMHHFEKLRIGVCLAAALVMTGCSIEPRAPGAFYQAETDLAGSPGEIIRAEPLYGAPKGARAWRVLYRSTGLSGEPIAVSGVIVAPGEAAEEPRKVVAWAHPTTGVADRCAPSLGASFFGTVPQLESFLQRGYIIAATDYPGLGTAGTHPYLVGLSEGRAVLDSVRAAIQLPDVNAANEFAVWGHSQGGHAALFAGQLAADYAPDLKLSGVAAAAPATDLVALFKDDISMKAGKVLTAYAIWSWNRIYDAPLSGLMDEAAISAMDRLAKDCLEGKLQGFVVAERERGIDRDFLQTDLTEVAPWKSLLTRNSPTPGLTGAPVLLAQGTADPVVQPAVTLGYARAACRAGTPLSFILQNGADHLGVVKQAGASAAGWIADRLEGATPPSDCNDLPTLPASG
ncbi:alpha/beta fold hydrolase [Chelativorans sp. M5D2P16]|uniref:alpha/beta fold hydrolase n=1 Tax=Chelativorans sp. M5D2P16 TaxID=3095678 RepID=UPI002ACA5057|nr:alpha/beta fold hydrolase [Chelativorans sp. M5D2P16]MDZ5696347.1 alpha/beta fold hydrolase [Chelativorans sp. M5D2P16]